MWGGLERWVVGAKCMQAQNVHFSKSARVQKKNLSLQKVRGMIVLDENTLCVTWTTRQECEIAKDLSHIFTV